MKEFFSSGNLDKRRWLIAAAAVVMQLCLGAIYTWSVFKKPLMIAHGWSETATQTAFMICIAMIGLANVAGGILADRFGCRLVASGGGLLYGVGMILAGCAERGSSLPLLYLSFGLLAGLGIGLAYVTPIATLIRWFPDRRGLVTGLAIMGFGAGAFFFGQAAPAMINAIGVARTWTIWGALFLVLVAAAAQFYRDPPAAWHPRGRARAGGQGAAASGSFTFGQALKSGQFRMLWLVLFLNATAGLGLLSQLSPLAQEIGKRAESDPRKLAMAGGLVVAIASICNGAGRLFWAWLSDHIGRRRVFILIFASEIVLYLLLPRISGMALFTAVSGYLLSGYGGGFATMPAFVADSFGPEHIAKIYGVMLTAWSAAGVLGPLQFAAFPLEAPRIAAATLALGLLLTLAFRPPRLSNS